MSNKHFNNNKKVSTGHEFQLSPGEYSDIMVSDFFCFTEGKYDEMKILKVDRLKSIVGDIKQMSNVLAGGERIWKDYCEWYGLPRECKKLFINKVKRQWQDIENIQKGQRDKKTPRNSLN